MVDPIALQSIPSVQQQQPIRAEENTSPLRSSMQRWSRINLGLRVATVVACIAALINTAIAPVALALFVAALTAHYYSRNFEQSTFGERFRVLCMEVKPDRNPSESDLVGRMMEKLPAMEYEAKHARDEGTNNPQIERKEVISILAGFQAHLADDAEDLEKANEIEQLPQVNTLISLLRRDITQDVHSFGNFRNAITQLITIGQLTEDLEKSTGLSSHFSQIKDIQLWMGKVVATMAQVDADQLRAKQKQ